MSTQDQIKPDLPEGEQLQAWRKQIASHRKQLLEHHREGTGGFDLCENSTAFFDELVGEVFDFAAKRFKGNVNIALCATGSYGRRELAPYSDIDLMFLLPADDAGEVSEFVHEVIRLLWDTGIEISHVARTLMQSLQLARTDPTVKTTFIDLRLIRGEGKLYEEVVLGFDHLVSGGEVTLEVPRKQEAVNLEPGYPLSSITVLEPNLKESPGSLRDYHLALWSAQMRYFKKGLPEIARAEIISPRTEIEVRIAVDFLLRLRNELHFLQGRKADALTLELQGDVAENLGYIAAGLEQAIEALLRDYYHAASTIFRFSKDLVDRCLERGGPPSAKAITRIEDGIIADGAHLEFEDKTSVAANPVLLVRIFRLAAERGIPLSTRARKMARTCRYLMDEDLRENPDVVLEFMQLLSASRAAPALREMHDCYILGDLLPEFGALHHLVQYDVFHRFTADEHTLLAIHFLEELLDANDSDLQTLAQVYRSIPEPQMVKLAILLHDIGKAGGPGHIERGIRLIPIIAHRLGLSDEATGMILQMVRHHQLMNELAIKRDIHDPTVMRDFTRQIGDEQHLKWLYLVTYADMKAVGPGVWNSWKAALLEELYQGATRMLARRPEETTVDYYRKVRQDSRKKLEGKADPEILQHYFDHMPERFLGWLNPDRILRQLAILKEMDQSPCKVNLHREDRVGYLEVLVCSRDTHGLFSQIAGVLTAQNLNILGAQVFTMTDGVILDTIQVQAIEEEEPPPDEMITLAVQDNLTDILQGNKEIAELLAARPRYFHKKKRRRVSVPTSVRIDNDLSAEHTVMEVTARDRPGLLYEITDCIRSMDLNIYLAKINTEAMRLIDVFYLDRSGGKKITDEETLKELKAAIYRVIRTPGRSKHR